MEDKKYIMVDSKPGSGPSGVKMTLEQVLKDALQLQQAIPGVSNTALGEAALDSVTTGGNYNVAVGANALTADATGDNNVAVGYNALAANTGGNNVAVGKDAGLVVTGGNNILIGTQTGDNLSTGTDNILIGHDLAAASAAQHHVLDIGDLIGGHVAATQLLRFFTGTAAVVQQLATTDLGTVLSNYGLRVAGTAYPITTTGIVTLSDLRTVTDVGAVVAGKCTAVEYGDGVIHKTVLSLTLTGANDLDLANADHGTGVKIYDFPAGRIHVLGVVMNGVAVTNDAFEADPNDVYLLSCGSVVGADDATLSSTEVDLIPSTTLDSVGNTTLTLDWHAALAAAAVFDGTTTALDLYVNAAVAGASLTKDLTIAITGTLTVTWINLGDY